VRIHITGNAGSGKTTMAKELGLLLGIDVYGLDKIVWQEGWITRPPKESRRLAEELCQKTTWVIEGVSSIVRESADVVIFLDFSRRECYWRCLQRNWRYLFKSRPELPDHCPEIKILPKLVKIIWQFSSQARPKIISGHGMKNQTFVILSSNKDIESFLEEISHSERLPFALR
jgi:adenylate kinase family enzyme